jgi:hypothetical protein
MHSVQRPRPQSPVRKQARDQKQQCVSRQKVISQGVRGSKCNDNTNQSDHGQANAHHRRGDSENMDADILLQMRVWMAVPVSFSSHADQLLDCLQNRLFRR